jgi:hypothetical protein
MMQRNIRMFIGLGLFLTPVLLWAAGSSAKITSGFDISVPDFGEAILEIKELAIGSGSPGQPQIRIKVGQPQDATIRFAGRSGEGTLIIDSLSPGIYLLECRSRNYLPLQRQIQIQSDYRYEISIQLNPALGRLDLQGPIGTVWLVDGENPRPDGLYPVGAYRVRGQLFGYEDLVLSVDLNYRARITVEAQFVAAPFRLLSAGVDRAVFRPQNPGPLGTCVIRFRVSAPGAAVLEILGDADMVLMRQELPDLSTWDHGVIWDGRNSAQQLMGNGVYRYRIIAEAPAGYPVEGPLELTGTVQIDDSLYAKYRPIHGGLSGLLFVPDAYTLPPGSAQISLNQGWAIQAEMLQTDVFVRLGLIRHLELATALALRNAATQTAAWDAWVALGLKWAVAAPGTQDGWSLALGLDGGLPLTQGSRGFLPEAGGNLGLQVPIQYRNGLFLLSFGPQVGFVLQVRDWHDFSLNPGNVWLGLNGGLALDGEGWSLGLSGRVLLLAHDLGLKGPDWRVGLDGSWNIPQSILYLTGAIDTGAWAADSVGVRIRLGIGLIP